MASEFSLRQLVGRKPESSPFTKYEQQLDERLAAIKDRLSQTQPQPTLKSVTGSQSLVSRTAPLLLSLLSNQKKGVGGRGSTPDLGSRGTAGLTFGVPSPRYEAMSNRVLSSALSRFGDRGVRSGGIFNARNIAGTNTPSEHAYGAAVDLMVPNTQVGNQLYNYLMKNQNKFGFTSILWQVPDHYNHIHVGFLY